MDGQKDGQMDRCEKASIAEQSQSNGYVGIVKLFKPFCTFEI